MSRYNLKIERGKDNPIIFEADDAEDVIMFLTSYITVDSGSASPVDVCPHPYGAADLDNPAPDNNVHDKLNRIEQKIDKLWQSPAQSQQHN